MRIISGSEKGRRLVAPKGTLVRPTTDRVKEAMFSMLSSEGLRSADRELTSGLFPFTRVLDLYAGSGALGIEALSRGAHYVDFVECDPRARAIIRENLERTGLTDRATVHGIRAEAALSTIRSVYDLILLDPPYGDPAVFAVLHTLASSTLVAARSVVVVEHARSSALPEMTGRLMWSRTRTYGASALTLYVCGT